jgi:hypothetical protein
MHRTYELEQTHSTWDSGNARWEIASDDLDDRLDGVFAHHFICVDGLTAGQTYTVDIRFAGSFEFKTHTATVARTDFVAVTGMRVNAIRVTPSVAGTTSMVLQSVPKGFN